MPIVRAFWYRVGGGGHRATPRWTLHYARRDGTSFCGLVARGSRTLDATHNVARGLQGRRNVCISCVRLDRGGRRPS